MPNYSLRIHHVTLYENPHILHPSLVTSVMFLGVFATLSFFVLLGGKKIPQELGSSSRSGECRFLRNKSSVYLFIFFVWVYHEWSPDRGRFANPLPAHVIVDFISNFTVWHIVCGKGDQNSSELLSPYPERKVTREALYAEKKG